MSSGLVRPVRPVPPRSESALPSKLFFRIGEVASLVGVEPHVLRYWEREFRSIRPTKSAKGQRVYSRKDVENLLRVRDLLYRDGFTIAGAKKRLQRGGQEPAVALAGDSAAALEHDAEAQAQAEADADAHAIQDDDDTETETGIDSGGERADVLGLGLGLGLVAESPPDPPLREKLTALRAEVEAFLGELESEPSERA